MAFTQGHLAPRSKTTLATLTLLCLTFVGGGCTHLDSDVGTANSALLTAVAKTAKTTPRHPVPMHHQHAYFEPNQGQFSNAVQFAMHGQGARAYLTQQGFGARVTTGKPGESGEATRGRVLELNFANARRARAIRGERSLPGKSNYLRGRDDSRWIRNVPHYQTVRYEQVYPGIDALFYLRNGELEYDFIAEPHADPALLGLDIQGADKISLNEQGDLLIEAGATRLLHKAPRIYQDIDGERRKVEGGYRLANANGESPFSGQQVKLWLAGYDPSHELVIDPVLRYSTYYGGSGSENISRYLDVTTITGIEVDAAGNAYVVGSTDSQNLPLAGTSYDSAIPLPVTAPDAFLAKYDAAGTLLYATYLGGADADVAFDVSVGSDGSMYAVGKTTSIDFPTATGGTAGTIRPSKLSNTDSDGFVVRLNAAGDSLLLATYIGSDTRDEGVVGIDLNGGDEIFLAGYAQDPFIPFTAPSFQAAPVGGADAFIMHLNAAASSTLYSSFLGGNNDDFAYDIEVNGGLAYVVGSTFASTTPFPTTVGAVVTGGSDFDGFLSIVDTSLSGAASLLYSARIGGVGLDKVKGVTVDGVGDVYLTGQTASNDFPISAVRYDAGCGGVAPGDCASSGLSDGFVMKLRPSLPAASAILYSTFIGGDFADEFVDVAVDASGNAYVGGVTESFGSFPSIRQIPLNATSPGLRLGAVAKVVPDGGNLAFAGVFGGSSDDEIGGLDIDAANNVYLAGVTNSFDFTLVNAEQPSVAALPEAFVARLGFANIVNVSNDLPDTQPGDGACETSFVTPNRCSLRAAIEEANAVVGPDLIIFDIPLSDPGCLSSVCTISPGSSLPPILDPVIIDGFTQPGSAANTNPPGSAFNSVLNIELMGAAAGGGVDGLTLLSGGNTIRGLAIGQFGGAGIAVGLGGSPGNNFIHGNYIGTDASGLNMRPNGGYGVFMDGASTFIGGPNVGEGNLISNSGLSGVRIANTGGILLVQGNYVGTDANGSANFGNGQNGIELFMVGPGITVGGGGLGQGNLFSGNVGAGVKLFESDGTLVRGNFIGTDLSGVNPLPNGDGLLIDGNSANNQLGGPTLSDGNLIAFNTGNGIALTTTAAGDNLISLNSIHSNGGLGIDINEDGVTGNDPLDGDTGPNDVKNFPDLLSATDLGGSVQIMGDYHSAASSSFTLEFFENSGCDATGNGEGERYIGSLAVTTDALGDAQINTVLPIAVTVGNFISATARGIGVGNNTSEFSNCVIIDVPASIDLSMNKNGPASVGVGATFSYTLSVFNAGPSTATSVSVSDTLPPGLSFVFASGPSGPCTYTPPNVTCGMGSIAPLASANAILTVRAPASPATINNTATATALEPDVNALNNTSTATTNVIFTDADVAISKTASLTSVNVGGTLTYTLNVSNRGPLNASNVNVSDVIPAQMSLTAFSASQGSCGAVGNNLNCALGGLNVGANATISIDVSAITPGNVNNTAFVSASQPDAVTGNNSSSATVTVNAPQADLALSVSIPPDVTEDGFFDVLFTGVNLGPEPASGVVFDWTPPAGFNIVSITPSQGSCLPISTAVHCDLSALATGANVNWTVKLRAPAAGSYSSTAVIAGNELDTQTANNSVSVDFEIGRRVADLSITKLVTPDPVRVDNSLIYQLTVTNAGPDYASDIVILDNLPIEVAYVGAAAGTALCTHVSGLLTCTLSELPAGASEHIDVAVQALSDGTISNTAGVSSASLDPNTGNNQATVSHVIQPRGLTIDPGGPDIPNDEPVPLPPDSELPDLSPRGPGDGLADESLEGMVAEPAQGGSPLSRRPGRFGRTVSRASTPGQVYVVGYAYNGHDYDIHLLKYDSNRNEVWSRRIDSGAQDYGYAVGLGPNGHVYIGGYTLAGNVFQAVAYSFTADGDMRWKNNYSGGGRADAFFAISADASGVYFAGETHTGSNFDALVVKYDTDGARIWTRRLPAPQDGTVYAAASTFCKVSDGVSQKSECRLIVGGAQGMRDQGRHAFIAELSAANGEPVSVGEIENSGPINAFAANGGDLFAAANGFDGNWVMTRFDTQLNSVWRNSYSFNGAARVRALTLNENGQILAAGTLRRDEHDDLLIGMFDASGARLDYMSISGGAQESGHGIAVSSDKRLLISGQRSVAPGNTRFLLFRVFN